MWDAAIGMESQRVQVLRRAVACLLPEPLNPDDCLVLLGEEARKRCGREVEAVLVQTRSGGKARRRRDLDHLPHRHRFVMVPRTARPRALLPAGSSSREQRPLLRPRSTSATSWRRVELGWAKVLRFAASKFMGAPLELATSAPSSFSHELTHLFPGHRLGFFLGNPYNYRRPALHVFQNDDLVAIGKFAFDEDQRRRISREWEMLCSLKRIEGLTDAVPSPIAYKRWHLGEVLLTDAFPAGDPGPIELTPSAKAWLQSCQLPRTADAAKTALIKRLTSELAEVAGSDEVLSSIVRKAIMILQDVHVPVCVVHGDFVPWNTVLDRGTLRVFDWEYGCPEGLPSWDETHFMLQVGLIVHGWSRHEFAAALESASAQPTLSLDFPQKRAVMALVVVQLVLRNLEANNYRAAALFKAVAADMLTDI